MAKNLILWLIIAAVLLTVFQKLDSPVSSQEIAYSQFVELVRQGDVKKVSISGPDIEGEYNNGQTFETVRPIHDPKLMDDLFNHKVEVKGKKQEQQSIWTQLLVASFPILVIIAVFMFFMRQMQGGGGGGRGPMAFGKSKAK
ncbi:ATP-dependent metalloprotease, partial [Bermanella sp. 47_1433_sub80_T6]